MSRVVADAVLILLAVGFDCPAIPNGEGRGISAPAHRRSNSWEIATSLRRDTLADMAPTASARHGRQGTTCTCVQLGNPRHVTEGVLLGFLLLLVLLD